MQNLQNAKLKREQEILTLLHNAKQVNKGYTIKHLSELLDVCRKTIARDFDKLDNFVIRKGNTWYLRDNINSQNSDELILKILDEMARSVGGDFSSRAHDLLMRVISQVNNPIYANLNAEKLNIDDIKTFQTLESALNKKVEITFRYKKDSKNAKNFCVKPLKVAFFDGFWYLLAFDISGTKSGTKEVFKKFYIKDISDIVVSERVFEVSIKIQERLKSAHNVWFQLGKTTKVNLLIDKSVSKYFLRKPMPTQILKGKHTNGDLEIQIEISHEMEITPLIFYYLPHIKVLSPTHLQDKVISTLKEYLAQVT